MDAKEARESLVREIVTVIVQALNLRHVNPKEITENTPLVADGLQLDSVDILETVVTVENHFGVKVVGAEEGRRHFQTIGTIADFVELNRAK